MRQVKDPEVTNTALLVAISQVLNSREFIESITAVVMKAVSIKFDEFIYLFGLYHPTLLKPFIGWEKHT